MMNVSESRESPQPTSDRELASLRAVTAVAERRSRAVRMHHIGATAAAVALFVVALVLVLRKLSFVGEGVARGAIAFALLGFIASLVAAYMRRLAPFAGAVALDKHHHLSDRLTSALSFSSLPTSARTPFMNAAIDDALVAAKGVDPRKAVPFTRPRDLPVAAAMLGVVVLVALFEVRKHEPVLTAKTIEPVDVTADDLDAMRDFLKEMAQKQETEEAKAATQEFNQLIEDLAAKRLDRTEAFRRMQALETKLLEGREADAKAFEEALSKIGEELKKSELTKKAGDALENKNLAMADKEFKELAKKLREQGKNVDKAQIEKMRDALKKASESQKDRAEALAKQRDALQKDLLQQKQKMGDAGVKDEEKSLLQKRERELERLNRETEREEAARRELERLDRELSQAAEDLMKDLGVSANDLDRAAEDINRMARQSMSQEEKEQLRQKLQELREMLRQQGQGGQSQMQRLRKFQQRARGQNGQGQGEDGEGEQGDGQKGKGERQGQGEGEGQNGQGKNGQGKGQGGGKGGGQGESWVLGPNGEKILMISRGQGQGGGQGGGGKDTGGKGAGTGHDDHITGAKTNPKGGTVDSQVAGQETGQGGSRSEVIQGAAEKGFASRGYQNVYREYHTVAEEALNRDEVPGGYRSYVRRYFQLIRPREDGAPTPPPAQKD